MNKLNPNQWNLQRRQRRTPRSRRSLPRLSSKPRRLNENVLRRKLASSRKRKKHKDLNSKGTSIWNGNLTK